LLYNQLQFHNVTELDEQSGTAGVRLHRFPKEVRNSLSDRARFISEDACGCEVRFVTEAKWIRITLCIPESDGDIFVYKGGLFHSKHRLKAGAQQSILLEEPLKLRQADRTQLMQSGFAPEVWRICFGKYICNWSGVNTYGYPVRPPYADEVPSVKWLAYGSSITHGLHNQPMTYIQQAARRLGVDVYNCGLGGSCRSEKEIADYFASRDDWHTISLELGINMVGSFTPEQFHERTHDLLQRLIDTHPDKPIFLITMYPYSATLSRSEMSTVAAQYNEVLRDHVRRFQHPALYLIEGSQVLDDCSGLTTDLLHPGEYGHTAMAYNLAALMKQELQVIKGGHVHE